jgi:hypothetical protein
MADLICPACGYEGRPPKQLRGSKGMEWFLWLTFIVPGPFYSAWRRMGVQAQCTHCRKASMVSLRSNVGEMARHKFDVEMGIVPAAPKQEPLPIVVNTPREARIKKAPVNPEQW